jgi:hypothetical protein
LERKNLVSEKYMFRRGNSKSRLDLILISEELFCHILSFKIIHCPFSRHDIKDMKLNVFNITRGPETWIMNLHSSVYKLVGKFEIRKTTFFKCDGMVGHCKG